MNSDPRYTRLSLDHDDPNGHVAYLSFGKLPDGQESEISHLAHTLPAVSALAAERLTRTAYQNQYGIFPHHDARKAQERPLALVAMHPKENSVEGSLRYTYIRLYYQLKIGDIFHVSYHEFFDLPMDEADFLCEIAKRHAQTFEKTANEVERQLQLDFQNGHHKGKKI